MAFRISVEMPRGDFDLHFDLGLDVLDGLDILGGLP